MFAATSVLGAQTQGVLSIPPDSPRWELEGKAKPADYQGRKSLFLDGGATVLKDFEMRDGVVDVDVATPASRGFFGIQFRIANEGVNSEWVYLRQHKSGYPDAMQYTPVLNTGLNWQLYNGPGFTGAVDIPKDVWFHLRLEVAGAQARLFVKDMEKPALVMNESQERCSERTSRTVCIDRRHVFLKLRNSLDSRCPMGTASAVDTVRNPNEVESVAVVRCATT